MTIGDDIAEISRLRSSHVNDFDQGRIDHLIDLFCDDAVLDLGSIGKAEGREEIAALFERISQSIPPASRMHAVSNPIIEIEGDRATGEWVAQIYRMPEPGGTPVLGILGYYRDVYRRTADGWRFSSLKLEPVWAIGS